MESLSGRSSRSSSSESISFEPSFFSAASTLPELPPKAKPRFDHLGFREQGSEAAEHRAKILSSKIDSLKQEEEQLRRDQNKLSISATKELDDAVQRQHVRHKELRGMDKEDLRKLDQKVAEQFENTRKTLKDALKRHNEEQLLAKKEDIWKGLTLPDNMIATSQNLMTVRKANDLAGKERAQRKDKLKQRVLIVRMKALQAKLAELKKQMEPQDSNVDGSHDQQSGTEDQDERSEGDHDEEDHGEDEHGKRDHGEDDHDEENHDEENHDEENHDEENHDEENHDEENHDEENHDEENHGEDEHGKRDHGEDDHDEENHDEENHDEENHGEDEHGKRDHGEDDHAEDEHGEDEHAEDEHAEDEHAEDDHAKDEHAKDEHAKDEHAKDEHAQDEHGEDEHAEDDHGEDDHAEDEHAEDDHAEDDHAKDQHDEDQHDEDQHDEDESDEDESDEDESDEDESERRDMSMRIEELDVMIEAMKSQIRNYQDSIDVGDKRIKRLRNELRKLNDNKDNKEETAMQLGDDEHGEQGFKMAREQQERQELEELEQQDARQDILKSLKRDVISKRYYDAGSVPHQQLWRRYARHRYAVDQYSWSHSRRAYRDYRSMFDWDDMFDEMDDEDNEDDPVRQPFLEVLERIINDTQILEGQIREIRQHREKLNLVVDLKMVLQTEMELENKWLQHLKGHGTWRPSDNSTNPQHDHFSGGPITDKDVYQPLKDDQIRVLVVLPAPEPYYPLICALETWSPKDFVGSATGTPKRQYAALSYFWGSDTYNGRIYLLSHRHDAPSPSSPNEWGTAASRATRVRIRNNLFRALLRLRRHGPKASAVALWVDFMCINQDDAQEKTQQLARMVNIYSNASNVCIWLGESDSQRRSDEAMKFISTIMDFAVLDRHAKDKRQAKKWYALGELMRDRWFSRRWVVQEVALSKDATIHCGEAMVRWSDFADAAALLVSNQESIKSLFDLSEWREGPNTLGDVQFFGAAILLEATNNLFLRKHHGEIKRPIKSIESLVTSLKTFDTTDRRDLIYSLVCIASDTRVDLWAPDIDESPTACHAKLEVDYSRSEVHVYKDFTQFCITSSSSLDIICRPWAMPVRDEIPLPSWIPLLSSSEFGKPEEVYGGRKNGVILVGPAGRPNYRASGARKSSVSHSQDLAGHGKVPNVAHETPGFVDENGTLFAEGFKLAKIKKVSPRNTGGVILRESLRMGQWTGIRNNPDSVPDPIWRTLVADRDQDGQAVPPSWYQRACLRCLEIADTFNNGDLNVGELLQGHSEMLCKYLMRVRNVTWNRRFLTATVQNPEAAQTGISQEDEEQQALFGLCPPESEEDDFICILYGCSVPVVLRENPDSSGCMKLIGEVYVHGKMDGEAIEDIAEGKVWSGVEIFKIR